MKHLYTILVASLLVAPVCAWLAIHAWVATSINSLNLLGIAGFALSLTMAQKAHETITRNENHE